MNRLMYTIVTNEKVKLELQNGSKENRTQEMGTERGERQTM